jgi:hypothetical protein
VVHILVTAGTSQDSFGCAGKVPKDLLLNPGVPKSDNQRLLLVLE